MSLNYELRHERHAIGEFTAALQFQKSLTEQQFGPVRDALKGIADSYDLPALAPLNVFRVGMPPVGGELPAAPISYQRFAKDGTVVAALICDDNTIAFTLREYTRWEDIEARIRDLFAEICDLYLPLAGSIRLLKLQYLNEFRAKKEAGSPPSEILKLNSKWIAPFVKENDEFWHCHIGAFIPGTQDVRHLVNVNCDFLKARFPAMQGQRNYLKALILAGCYYDIGEPFIDTGSGLRARLEEGLRAAHALERKTLAEVISDPYLELMGALNDDY